MTLAFSQDADASLRVLHSDAHLAVGAYAHVHLCIYRGDLTLERMELANGLHRKLIGRFPKTAIFGLAREGLALPPMAVRDRGAQLIRENTGHVDAAAVILPGEGFWASTVRSVVTASFLLARQPYPSRCHPTVEEGARWLLGLSSREGASLEGLCKAVDTLERA
jgi:hypothetical protein